MTLMGGVIIRLSNLPVRGAVTFLNRIMHLGGQVRHRMINAILVQILIFWKRNLTLGPITVSKLT